MAILTISREYGSSAGKWGQTLSGRLGYQYIDRPRILADMKALGGQWEKSEKDFGDHYPGIWERYDRSFQGYVALTQSLFLHYGLQNKVILLGRGGNFLFKGIPYALRIRITTPKETRIKNLLEQEDIGRETASWLIDKADHEMARTVQFIYGKKIDDPTEYDMVLNLDPSNEEALTRTVTEALAQKENQVTDAGLKILQMRALAAKVKAGIVTNTRFLIPTLDVEVMGEKIVLRGVIHNQKEHKDIEDEARKLAGAVAVECKLHYRGFTRK